MCLFLPPPSSSTPFFCPLYEGTPIHPIGMILHPLIWTLFFLVLWGGCLVQATPWYFVTYLPPIDQTPVTRLVPQNTTSGNLFQQPVYTQTDPVNNAVTSIPSACTGLVASDVPSDNQGYCYSACTQYTVSILDTPVVELFCLSTIPVNTGLTAELYVNATTNPQYMVMQCPTLTSGWQNTLPLYDGYSADQLGLAPTNNIDEPSCMQSTVCWTSVGFPRSTWDGPDAPILYTDLTFYCCRVTTSNLATPYDVSYTYTCTTTIYNDPSTQLHPKSLASCSRTVTLHGPGTAQTRPVITSTSTAVTCSATCIWPFFTFNRDTALYDPQPVHAGCAPTDFAFLCTFNFLTDDTSVLCTGGASPVGVYHYRQSQVMAMGFTSEGVTSHLPAGSLPSSFDLSAFGEVRTWKDCAVGQMGCTVYCNCWNGCPAHPKCNGNGILQESRNLQADALSCECDDGYESLSYCALRDSNQLCNHGARSSKAMTNLYYSRGN